MYADQASYDTQVLLKCLEIISRYFFLFAAIIDVPSDGDFTSLIPEQSLPSFTFSPGSTKFCFILRPLLAMFRGYSWLWTQELFLKMPGGPYQISSIKP